MLYVIYAIWSNAKDLAAHLTYLLKYKQVVEEAHLRAGNDIRPLHLLEKFVVQVNSKLLSEFNIS